MCTQILKFQNFIVLYTVSFYTWAAKEEKCTVRLAQTRLTVTTHRLAGGQDTVLYTVLQRTNTANYCRVFCFGFYESCMRLGVSISTEKPILCIVYIRLAIHIKHVDVFGSVPKTLGTLLN